jgi:hypothetical protein
VRSGDSRGPVRRSVVDDDDVESAVEGTKLLYHLRDRRLLVQRRHDRDAAELGEASVDRLGRVQGGLGQYAPRRASTAGNVFARIEMSSQIDQFSR